ncbi:adenylyl-sulfate kinase [Patescibacteria group bacterium]|nr:adenylyl-sulfate kinase [Patescibacteria group bacterium]
MKNRFPVVWLTGNSGAGKTTLAFAARDYFNEDSNMDSPLARRIVILDGDEMRNSVSVDEGFSPEDRRRHNLRVARLANLMSAHGFLVIVAVIAPFEKVRNELQPICDPRWVHIKRDGLNGADRPYEPPTKPDFVIDNNVLSIEEGINQMISYLRAFEICTGEPKRMPIKKEGTVIKVG